MSEMSLSTADDISRFVAALAAASSEAQASA